jgi:hypothetical protein
MQGTATSPSFPRDNPMGRILAKPNTDEPTPRYTTILRHFAIVVDASSDGQGDENTTARPGGSVSLFSDGEMIESRNVSVRAICAAANSAFHSMIVNEQKARDAKASAKNPKDVYVVGARDESHPPGSSVSPDTPIELQQFRVYLRALNPAQIKGIHDTSQDSDGNLLRKCSRLEDPKEKDNLGWKDDLGHDCAWYATHRTSSSFICSGDDVQTNCKVACSQQQCFSANRVEAYDLGRQVQMFTDSTTLCVSSKVSDAGGLPLMDGATFNETVCNATSAESDPSADTGSKALQNLFAAIGMLDPAHSFSAPTQTSWAISPKAGGNVTLVFTTMDLDMRKEVVTVRPLFIVALIAALLVVTTSWTLR